MRKNLELSDGLIFAEALTAFLGEKISRSEARSLVDGASAQAGKEKRHLREVIERDKNAAAHFSKKDLDKLFDARNYVGAANPFIDRVIERHKSPSKK